MIDIMFIVFRIAKIDKNENVISRRVRAAIWHLIFRDFHIFYELNAAAQQYYYCCLSRSISCEFQLAVSKNRQERMEICFVNIFVAINRKYAINRECVLLL